MASRGGEQGMVRWYPDRFPRLLSSWTWYWNEHYPINYKTYIYTLWFKKTVLRNWHTSINNLCYRLLTIFFVLHSNPLMVSKQNLSWRFHTSETTKLLFLPKNGFYRVQAPKGAPCLYMDRIRHSQPGREPQGDWDSTESGIKLPVLFYNEWQGCSYILYLVYIVKYLCWR